MTGRWADSTRASRLPKNWPQIRRRILKRDPICRQPGCSKPSVEVDHIRPGDDHRATNLQGLCREHHRAKTQREAAAARERLPKRERPAEPHPGFRR